MIVTPRIRVDSTCHSVVAVCACGWRHLSDCRSGVMAAAARHVDVAHPATLLARSLSQLTASAARRAA